MEVGFKVRVRFRVSVSVRVRFRVRVRVIFFFNQVGLPLLRPRSGDNLIALFWNSGLVQIDCRCNSR